ncbi:unnamed protein product [Amoebophrya sp. A25]|nr:unnamed protein product [Amoebophrya sp. A25]|eukprot:GSA25T00008336001.1
MSASSSSSCSATSSGCLSPGGEHLVTLPRRNQFRILTDRKSVFTHTDAKQAYSGCCQWFQFGTRDVIALSCTSGALQLWSFSTGSTELLGTVENLCTTPGGFPSMVAHEGRNSIFVATRNSVKEIDVDSREVKQTIKTKKDPVLRMACGDDRLVAASATKIRVFTVADGACVSKHAATLHACTDLALVGSKILACDSSETVTIYDYTDSSFSSSLRTSGQTPLKQLTQSGNALVALSADGKRGFVWSSIKAAKSNVPLAATSEFEAEESVLSLRLTDERAGSAIAVLGAAMHPSVVDIEDIRSKGLVLRRANSTTGNKRPSGDADESHQKPAKVQVTSAAKVAKSGGQPLITEAARQQMERAEAEIARQRIEQKRSAAGVVSLAPLVRQYLKSQDATVLASCFAQADRKIVTRSCQELTGQEAFSWSLECQRLLFTQPSKCSLLLEWVRQVLTQHCSFLLSNPEMKNQLQPLYRLAQERLEATEPMQRIQGKLDLLLCTARERMQAPETQEPLRKFEAGSEEVSDAGEEGSDDGSSSNGDETNPLLEDDDDFVLEEFI